MAHVSAVRPLVDVSADSVELARHGYLARYEGNTRRSYAIDMRAWFGWLAERGVPVFEARRQHIEIFGRWLEEDAGLKASSAARRVSTVVGFYRFATHDDFIEKNPADYVRRPKVPVESQTLGLSYLEFAMFFRAAEELGATEHCLATLLGLLGLRVSEACGIQLTDFDDERGHRVVRIVGKGSKPAVIPLPVPVVRAIERAAAGRTEGPLLRTRTGAQMDRSSATRAVRRICRKAGITKRISPHSLRHSYVTQLLDAGVPLRDVQIAARHADPRMTARYDRGRGNLDRHANYALAARMSG